MMDKTQALDNAIAEVIDWIANGPSKEADRHGDTAMINAYAQITKILKDNRPR